MNHAPPGSRTRRIAVLADILAAREQELKQEIRDVEREAEARIAKLRERATKEERRLNDEIILAVQRRRELEAVTARLKAEIEAAERQAYLDTLPNEYGGPAGLYAATEEIRQHEANKRRAGVDKRKNL